MIGPFEAFGIVIGAWLVYAVGGWFLFAKKE